MKRINLRLGMIVCLFLLCVTNMFGENDHKKDEHAKLTYEQIKEKQANFFTTELQLTTEEAKKFVPLMQGYMKTRYDLFKDQRKRREDKNLSAEQYTTIITEMVDSKVKEADLQKKYYEDLLKILPAEKVYKYQFVEKKYIRDTLARHKKVRTDRK